MGDSAGTSVGGIHPTMSLPGTFHELLVVIAPFTEGGDTSMNITISIPFLNLQDVARTYMGGEYYPPYSENIYSAAVEVNKTTIKVSWTSKAAEDTTEFHYMSVYYR